ncbi:MAG: hypothetical protein WCW14_02165 [Candidatus Paceibacterota bacterium]|jgi:hypothetical protein
MFQTWGTTLSDSFTNLGGGIVAFIPNLVVAIIIFVAGVVIASFVGSLVARIIKALKVDNALRAAGIEQLVTRAGFTLSSGGFLGALVKWFVIIVFLVASLDVLKLTQVNQFLSDVVLNYLPQVIVAVFMLLVAAVVAQAMQRLVIGSAKAANIASAAFLGNVTKWAIWIFAIIAALFQLGIAPFFIQTLLTGVVVALALAFGLAFGLGGQEAAARSIERIQREIADRHNQ